MPRKSKRGVRKKKELKKWQSGRALIKIKEKTKVKVDFKLENFFFFFLNS